MLSNSIDCIAQGEMRFKKKIKSYSNNQWLWYWEQTWFDKVDTLHTIYLNQDIVDEEITITLRN
jgi:hypothetical protein